MKLDNQILIEKYYNKVQQKYPDLSFDELKKIVSTPFEFLKQEMQSPELPTIRLKYLGVFVVYNGRAEYILRRTKESYQKGNITKKLHDERVETIERLLKKRESEME
jgi:hypothetical protein